MKNFILTLGFLSLLPLTSLAEELSSDLNLDQSNQPEQIEELTSNTNGSYLKADTNQLGQRYLVLFEKDSASCLIPSKVKLVWMPDHIQEKLEKALGDFIINDEDLSKELNLPLCNQDQELAALSANEEINYDNLEASFAMGFMPIGFGLRFLGTFNMIGCAGAFAVIAMGSFETLEGLLVILAGSAVSATTIALSEISFPVLIACVATGAVVRGFAEIKESTQNIN